ncbi:MAG: methylenetetrahydrofolate reductase [NAD(P)H] [Lachnospiraceae bacterium]|nr:methylenetetrahydrofolate reductase [NAD(P)H] [Lachnospiraceae bacterium]
MKIADIYKNKKTTLSFEIFPPKKDSELKNIDATLEILCELKPDFISVTFGAGGSSNCNRTIELAKKIKNKYHVEPVVHLTCLSYDKAEIDEFSQVLQSEGIENILALRGDQNPEVPEKEDFKHASELTAYLKQKGDFCIAGACYPECHPESENRVSEIRNLKKKVDAGAEVLLSQLFFDNAYFYRLVEDCRIAGIEVPVIPGIMPVINAAQIKRMVTMCGASFPARFEKIIRKYEGNKAALFDAGMSYALSQIIELLTNDIQGIHLYTMNNPAVAGKICDGIKNIIAVEKEASAQ